LLLIPAAALIEILVEVLVLVLALTLTASTASLLAAATTPSAAAMTTTIASIGALAALLEVVGVPLESAAALTALIEPLVAALWLRGIGRVVHR
jgi:hypothetical protein